MPKQKKKTKSERRWEEINGRRAVRYSQVGRDMEKRVGLLLDTLVEDGRLARATMHEPNSQADQEGRDFTVGIQLECGQYVERSFGITASARSWSKRPSDGEIPNFLFPIETKDETIISRVLALFEDC